jgi:hypothetical protein
MSMIGLFKRTTETAVKLPFAVVWDIISLGNMGDGFTTAKILREYERQKALDEIIEIVKRLDKIRRY